MYQQNIYLNQKFFTTNKNAVIKLLQSTKKPNSLPPINNSGQTKLDLDNSFFTLDIDVFTNFENNLNDVRKRVIKHVVRYIKGDEENTKRLQYMYAKFVKYICVIVKKRHV